ncbi:hypothetical protein OROGR_023249 [Orobanche gracilis]
MKRSDIASVSTDRGFIANIVLGTGDHVCMFCDFALNFLFFCAFVFSFRSVSYFFRRPAGASHIFMELVMEAIREGSAGKGGPQTELPSRMYLLQKEIQRFFEISVNSSYEGLIFKTLNIDAAYEPSRRSHNWLKLKRAYFEGLGDSLYLVPVAAYYGHGNQTGVYGTFVPACYDTNKEEFQSISKIGKGFSDALLEERSASLGSKVIPKPKKGSTLMYGLTQHSFQHFDYPTASCFSILMILPLPLHGKESLSAMVGRWSEESIGGIGDRFVGFQVLRLLGGAKLPIRVSAQII